jgi:hypothetical protein
MSLLVVFGLGAGAGLIAGILGTVYAAKKGWIVPSAVTPLK